ncbi:MAG: hypothetical protein ACQEWU_21510 [Bacillota bacterium]|uniref:Bacterial EndoU nuclease domain-containing protein n=1 Tax=Virgibacillus salarius TaxID=447199 RepID=A0A941IER9_9BACI|nr:MULTISPECIES: hypothetical protein [Virgibacillus]MBR7798345.1 hypothetical protein [Virgibacillus salarius]MCC2252776.1 hypothetical protein [Virgibacillus sp. AGTR]NAZ11054.1 hypothetical protein [Agaribacter marinus]WBX80634.1 hypothetical protein PD280_01895 [Virgibacillus salarius]
MKRSFIFFSAFVSFVLLFSFLLPSISFAKEGVENWVDIIEEDNSVTYNENPELFTDLEEVDWDKFVDDPEDGEESYLIESGSTVIQPFFWGLVARVVLSGGKHVIKWGSKIFKKAPKSKVTNALKTFKTATYKTGSHTFKLTKTDMKHMLERHHPKYWNGTVKKKQTFYNPDLSVSGVKNIAISIAKQNRNTLKSKGTNSTFQVQGTVNGVKYVLGITKGHIKQLYPK